MNYKYLLFILVLAILVFPVSADIPSNFHIIKETVMSTGAREATSSAESHVVRNSTGALWTVYLNTSDESIPDGKTMSLAFSLDNGINWNEITRSIDPSNNTYYAPSITIDSHDTIHLIYVADPYGIYYRNYTMANGWGTVVQVDTVDAALSNFVTSFVTSAIDSQDVIHIIYDGYDPTFDTFLFYRNISPNIGLGQTKQITSYISPTNVTIVENPHVLVGTDNVVHIVFALGDIDIDKETVYYTNFSSSGWGTVYRMTDDPVVIKPDAFVMDSGGTFQLLLVEGLVINNARQLFYYNTSAGSNYKIDVGDGLLFGTDNFGGAGISVDASDTVHFIYDNITEAGGFVTGDHLYYRNLTAGGLSEEYQFLDRATSGVIYVDTMPIWSTYPAGNIPTSGMGFIMDNNSVDGSPTSGNGNTIEFATYPDLILPVIPPTPAHCNEISWTLGIDTIVKFNLTGGYTTDFEDSRNISDTCTWIVPPGITSIEYLVVGGGGAGGQYQSGGGGGAGGFRNGTGYDITGLGAINVTVGWGGKSDVRSCNLDPAWHPNVNGTLSRLGNVTDPSAIVADGGGSGGTSYFGINTGADGGSGGGGAAFPVSVGGFGNRPVVFPVQGFNGGTGLYNLIPEYQAGGGGGGAGDIGLDAVGGEIGGIGGDGGSGNISLITGNPVYYAGGGGGGSKNQLTISLGGIGGGGNGGGGYPFMPPAVNATPDTGGGGGGTGYPSCAGFGDGGSGVVIIRYATHMPTPTPTTTPTQIPTQNPFTSVTVESTFQLITMVVAIGVSLLILAGIALIILNVLSSD